MSNRKIAQYIKKNCSASAKQAQVIAKRIRPSINKVTSKAKSAVDKVKLSSNQIEAGVSGASEEQVKKNI